MNKMISGQLYQISQALIEIWETFREAIQEQKLDIAELSFRTGITDRELEDGFDNYSDSSIKNLFKIAHALDLEIDVKISAQDNSEEKSNENRGKGWINQTD